MKPEVHDILDMIRAMARQVQHLILLTDAGLVENLQPVDAPCLAVWK